ncbi:CCA tRNA nucleotidyltransferase [Bacillus altitudinis]|uniref:CCA tRNA nucleotidyltransferase n=1 Tax=Bacillus altitudinis TaxID=293387 RepID=UPI000D3A2A90|nr:CCA tRNA nucleotidyltransferase [Bacillus altitudinis]MDR7668495.1 CCA tRNA nucleotidyltransferase [Bacillus altitudinis]PUF91248.1 CCA tRNA nucleotidyltransferase [Bacillus altitudinis]PWN83447.1 CCA tRNA nucleotidyltransferase [Bacillus altitudinis]
MNEPFTHAIPILHKLHEHGYQAYFVGGAVRDVLLGREVGDIDIATDATPDVVESLFDKTVDVGKEHGTVIVLLDGVSYEVTTFRTESEYEDFRRPKEVAFISSLKEDLLRRDLTINAVAMDIHGDIIDHVGGKRDIKRRRIQTVGDPACRFQEDALRMMRAVRFLSQLGFELSKETEEAMKKDKHLLANISVERKKIEMEKLLKGRYCEQAIKVLISTKLYEELPGLKKDQLNETFQAFPYYLLDGLGEVWGAFIHLLGLDEVEAVSFLKEWKLSTKLLKEAVAISKYVDCDWDAEKMFEAGEHVLLSSMKITQLKHERRIFFDELEAAKRSYDALPIKQLQDLAVSGKDLMAFRQKPAGKWIAEELASVKKAVLQNQLENRKEAIEEWLIACDQRLEND